MQFISKTYRIELNLDCKLWPKSARMVEESIRLLTWDLFLHRGSNKQQGFLLLPCQLCFNRHMFSRWQFSILRRITSFVAMFINDFEFCANACTQIPINRFWKNWTPPHRGVVERIHSRVFTITPMCYDLQSTIYLPQTHISSIAAKTPERMKLIAYLYALWEGFPLSYIQFLCMAKVSRTENFCPCIVSLDI